MASSLEYRRYMDECLRAAAKAKSEEKRRSLLQLAQTWHEAINLEASAELVKLAARLSRTTVRDGIGVRYGAACTGRVTSSPRTVRLKKRRATLVRSCYGRIEPIPNSI